MNLFPNFLLEITIIEKLIHQIVYGGLENINNAFSTFHLSAANKCISPDNTSRILVYQLKFSCHFASIGNFPNPRNEFNVKSK